LKKRLSDVTSLESLPTVPTPPRLNKTSRRKLIRLGIIAGNLLLLVGIGVFILANRSASQTIRSGTVNSIVTTTNSLRDPLDSVSSSQIAVHAAGATDLPELTAVRNQADSESTQLAVSSSDNSIVAKPQLVNTGLKSKKDIIFYTAKASDTISSIAASFGVNANSVRWSNNMTGEAVAAGREMAIPPANGIVYKVKSGDTIASLVSRYQSDRTVFITVNDAESGNLVVGEYVWIPGGVVSSPVARFSAGVVSGSRRFGSCGVNVPGVTGQYDCGYCTWWAAYRRYQIGKPVPGGLGNARTWVNRASLFGLGTGKIPQPGAVIHFNSNHVGFVEKQNDDGSWLISEMNHDGWDVMNFRTLTAAQAASYGYIY